MPKTQYGGRKGYPGTLAILEERLAWEVAASRRRSTAKAMLDIVSAYDCIINELIFGMEPTDTIEECTKRWRRHGVPEKAVVFASAYIVKHGSILERRGVPRGTIEHLRAHNAANWITLPKR